MRKIQRLMAWLRRSNIDKGNTCSKLYWKLKTDLWYRPNFKRIGRSSVIRRPLLITHPEFISIGEQVHIREGIRLEVLLTPCGRSPSLEIGDNTNIEQNVHIVCHSRVVIGSRVSITANCAIVDVTHPYQEPSDIKKIGDSISDESSFVEIGDGSFIGVGTVILPNVRIGRHCVIGANSVVTRDVPDLCIAAGIPVKVLKRYDAAATRWREVRDSDFMKE